MLYIVIRGIFRFIFNIFCRWEVAGRENLPREGPVIVIANHVSNWDPIAVACACDRQVFFMAKEELFRYPIFGRILKMVGAFPVSRGHADRQAIRTALHHLKSGEIVGIFPEGSRSHSGQFLPPQRGSAFLAQRSGVPVVPMALAGTRDLWSRGSFRKFRIRIGQPFNLPPKSNLEGSAVLMMEKIHELLVFNGK